MKGDNAEPNRKTVEVGGGSNHFSGTRKIVHLVEEERIAKMRPYF